MLFGFSKNSRLFKNMTLQILALNPLVIVKLRLLTPQFDYIEFVAEQNTGKTQCHQRLNYLPTETII